MHPSCRGDAFCDARVSLAGAITLFPGASQALIKACVLEFDSTDDRDHAIITCLQYLHEAERPVGEQRLLVSTAHACTWHHTARLCLQTQEAMRHAAASQDAGQASRARLLHEDLLFQLSSCEARKVHMRLLAH